VASVSARRRARRLESAWEGFSDSRARVDVAASERGRCSRARFAITSTEGGPGRRGSASGCIHMVKVFQENGAPIKAWIEGRAARGFGRAEAARQLGIACRSFISSMSRRCPTCTGAWARRSVR
jgi:hypothetical protein